MTTVTDAPGPVSHTAVLSKAPALAELHFDPDAARLADFERTLQAEGVADLRLFLPPRSAANYLDTFVELVRVDLEWRWDRGTPKGAEEYLRQFPELGGLKSAVAAVAFEEYRARLRAGEAVHPAEYAVRFRIPTDMWPDPTPQPEASGVPVAPPAPAGPAPAAVAEVPPLAAVPEAGSEFLGFWLVEELGSGPAARVFVARQGDTAGRPVVLKVGFGLFAETKPVAYLHHTNIVPIYSLHQSGRVQAVCMPYFGGTTLDRVLEGLRARAARPERGDVLHQLVGAGRPTTKFRPGGLGGAWGELERLTYPRVVARLGAQLASGLAHAHERGVRHGALKPSNVLIADDGIPMLFDFPLTEDASLHGPPDFSVDIYALGLLLHELLTADLPLPDGPGGLPTGGDRDPALPRGLAPIVRRCLADPKGQYSSARELQADLERYSGRRSFWGRVREWFAATR
jgi:hypothetical protein